MWFIFEWIIPIAFGINIVVKRNIKKQQWENNARKTIQKNYEEKVVERLYKMIKSYEKTNPTIEKREIIVRLLAANRIKVDEMEIYLKYHENL